MPQWRLIFVILAIVLFIIAGVVALGSITGPSVMVLIAFGLAAFAVAHLP